jgi:hypothetical protein
VENGMKKVEEKQENKASAMAEKKACFYLFPFSIRYREFFPGRIFGGF